LIRKGLSLFAEVAKGFVDHDRLKLILFASGVKPATFVALKVNSQNLGEKFRFEQHLKTSVFVESRPRSFEEITKIQKNKVFWDFKGVWVGFDLFDSKQGLKLFKQYVTELRKQKHAKADKTAGKLYDYPSCCVDSFIKEHDLDYLKKTYSCYDYYKRLHDSVRKFPFVFHTPCSLKCKESAKMNRNYRRAVKKIAPNFYKNYSKTKFHKTDIIIDSYSDVLDKNNKTIWPKRVGYEYSVIAKTPFEGHYYLYSYLTRNYYARGTVLDAKVKMKYNYADIDVGKIKDVIKDLHHVRKFQVLGRNF